MSLPFQISHEALIWFVSGFYCYWMLGCFAASLPEPGPQSPARYRLAFRFVQNVAANLGTNPRTEEKANEQTDQHPGPRAN